MSFSASAKRARDSSQPLGLRVACLHECLEQFNLFGYHATRERLRLAVGATDPGWTPQQVVAAVELLEHARASWSRFFDTEVARQRVRKHAHRNAPHTDVDELFLAWHREYLKADRAKIWRVAGLGGCERCGHAFIHHHGGRACLECVVDANLEWSERCREPLPTAKASRA